VSEALSYGERALAWIVRQHFRIPPLAFWTLAVGGAVLAPFLSLWPALGSIAVALVGVFGVLRWRWHRRHTRLIVLPQPVTVESTDPLAIRAQQLILESLAMRLTAEEAALVHPIPTRVGPTDPRLADAIRRRLGGFMIVVGRIDRRADGGWSLFSGVLQDTEQDVIHLDWHTRDRLPGRAQWDVWLDRLTPTRDVQDVEEPLLMSGEIGAIVRSFAGLIASWAGDLDRAETELRAAIQASGDSHSAAIDNVRCELAKVLVELDRREEARTLLRERANAHTPSAELLRTFARILSAQPGDFNEYAFGPDDEARRTEALDALRSAAEIRADPKRPMTLYNLAALLGYHDEAERSEAETALRQAMAESRFYRRAWYARRQRGAMHWAEAERALTAGDDEAAHSEFAQAARWYSAALRSRPRFRFRWRGGEAPRLVTWFPRSPILHANAEDAHRASGHAIRATWHRRRAERARKRRIKVGIRRMFQGRWLGAYANFDFAVIGRQDVDEAYAAVMRAVALQQQEETEAAAADFAAADERFPQLALIFRLAARDEYGWNLPHGLPGVGPMDVEGVEVELRRRGLWADPE
jgi:tetratricopeptide (TPR) repeat protein